MKISLKIYIFFFLLLMLGMIIIASKKSTITRYQPNTEPVLEQSMSGVNAKRFDENGHLIQIVSMGSWVHYQGQTMSLMTLPALKMFQANGDIWNITAQKGEGYQIQNHGKLEKLHLTQDVLITRLGNIKDSWWQLKTEQLTFFSEKPSAMTDAPVIVNGPGVEIHAIGMRANLQNHQVDLLKDVKTYYAP